MKTSRAHASPRGGFTLVELCIGALLLSGLMLVAGYSTDRAMGLFRQQQAAQEVSARAHRTLHRVASELVFARRAALLPVAMEEGSSAITFRKCAGVAAAEVQWTDAFQMRWELEPGELDDGVDNDGDILVDEGRLVWVRDLGGADEQAVVFATGLCELLPGETFDGADEDGDGLVDERGLCFSIDGDVVTIQLGLQGIGPDRNTITKVVETSVLIRNAN